MTSRILLILALGFAPLAAAAMPSLGDKVGTNPTDAARALADAGCAGAAFQAEGGLIEAKCVDAASGQAWEVYIDPKTGAVADMKQGD